MGARELAPGTRLGSYELLSRIGEGGMGEVYAAVHVGLGKRVAIKTLRGELAADPGVRARFVREGKVAATVHHPNVVDIDDFGISDDIPYLVMELLEGETLHTLITRTGRLELQNAADIVVPVLSAMSAAHSAGVVHRDLKPDNIFLARGAGGLPVPKVLDFGISKLRESQSLGLTTENTLLGTPFYMSPEQASSARDVDARSDLYAIGVILYHAVGGCVPFNGVSLAQVIGQIMHAPPVPLRQWAPDVPEEFEALVLRLMSKEPKARHQDAREVGRELLRYASDRVALTYGMELELDADGGEHVVQTAPTLAQRGSPSTLRPTARSVRKLEGSSALSKVAALFGVLALVAIVAALSLWPRAPETETSISPSGTSDASPPRAASGAQLGADAPLGPQPSEASGAQLPAATAAPEELQPLAAQPSDTPDEVVPLPGAASTLRPASGSRPLPKAPRATPPKKTPRPSVKAAADDDVWGNRK